MKRPVLLLLLLMLAASALLGQVTITNTSPLPQGWVGVNYTYTFTAIVSPPSLQSSLTWSIQGAAGPPTLPAGLTLSPNGTLSGTPTTAQPAPFTFTVVATAGNFTNTMQFQATISTPTVTINSTSPLPNAFVGQVYTDTLLGSSTPAGITWFLAEEDPLPPGLNLNPNGTISGTPTTAGTYISNIGAQINNSIVTTTKNFQLTVYAGQILIQTTSLPNAVTGKAYSATVTANPSAVTWALNGVLPTGITFNTATGVFSGTSTSIGIYPLQLTASLTNYPNATVSLNLDVTGGPLAVPQTNLPAAVQGSAYTTTLSGTGGIPPYQWAFVNASNDGLTVGSTTGTITGTPTSSGSFFIPVTLSDATGSSITVNLNLFVANPLSVTTTSLPNGNVGTAYSQLLQAGGGTPPFTWAIVTGQGALPPGLSLSTAGTISGTPTTGGVYTFTVQVTDSGSRKATQSISIAISVGPLTITTKSLPTALLGVPYSQTVAVSGGATPYTWRLASGPFPQGLLLNPSTGVISGTPAGPLGPSTFSIQVTDSSNPAQSVTSAFTITVDLSLSITTLSLPAGNKGTAYSSTIVASGGTTPYTWSITSGAAPAGLTLNGSTGVVSGTPTATGTSLFNVTVTDAAGQTASAQFSVTINATATLTITTSGTFPATAGTAYTLALAATGGSPPYTWSATGLPAGLSVNGSNISGTPTAAANATVTLKVTDSQQQTATATITINVSAATPPPVPQVTLGAIAGAPATQTKPTLTLGSSYSLALTGTLTASFQSSVGGNPTEVGFMSSGGGLVSSVSFSIPAGATSAVFATAPALATGTVAGTITLTATLNAGGTDVTPSPAPTETIQIAAAAPVIDTVTFSNTGGGLTVNVIGYSTTREVQSGAFQFYTSSGPILTPVNVPVSTAFTTWYSNSASNQYGSQFTLTIPFSVAGTASDVTAVNVTLTNSKGASNSLQSTGQ